MSIRYFKYVPLIIFRFFVLILYKNSSSLFGYFFILYLSVNSIAIICYEQFHVRYVASINVLWMSRTNFVYTSIILTICICVLEKRKKGTLKKLSSVGSTSQTVNCWNNFLLLRSIQWKFFWSLSAHELFHDVLRSRWFDIPLYTSRVTDTREIHLTQV